MNSRSRRVAALPVIVLVSMALLLTGCGPSFVTSAMMCLPHPPTSVADYQTVFADRTVWSGGDIGATVQLPDGRVLWLFGDTLVDGLTPAGGMTHGMMRNSIVEQNGNCFSLVSIGDAGQRTSTMPAAEDGEWLWPSNAVVDAGGIIRVTALRMGESQGPQGWQWAIKGVDIVSIDSSNLTWIGTVHAPVTQDDQVSWGGGAIESGGSVYIYGWRHDHQIVARTTAARMSIDPWEFYTPTGWTTNREAAQSPAIGNAPAASFWIVPHNGGFLASAKTAEMNSDDVSTWSAPSPVGPWTFKARAATTAGAGSAYITYAGRVANLPGVGLTTVWSQNGRNYDANFDFRNFGLLFAKPASGAIS